MTDTAKTAELKNGFILPNLVHSSDNLKQTSYSAEYSNNIFFHKH